MVQHKANLDEYKIKSKQPLIKWSFDLDIVFERLNAFCKRLHDVHEMIGAAKDFLQLEKIEIGGIKGRYFSERIRSVLNEFHNLYNVCIANQSNLLEPCNRQFKCLKRNFQSKIMVLERKLSQICMATFVSCNNTESSIKVVEMFGGLLDRFIIKEQLTNQFGGVIRSIQNDIHDVHTLLTDNLHRNHDWVSNKSLQSSFTCDHIYLMHLLC